jgi:hypothetical protein
MKLLELSILIEFDDKLLSPLQLDHLYTKSIEIFPNSPRILTNYALYL